RGRQAPERACLAGRGGLRSRRVVQAGLAGVAQAPALPGAGSAAVDLARGLDEILDARRLPLGPGRLRRQPRLPRPARRPARTGAARRLLPRRPRQRGLCLGRAVLLLPQRAPTLALERARHGPVRRPGLRHLAAAARCAFRFARCLDADGLLAGRAAAASRDVRARHGHAGARCEHPARPRWPLMVAADFLPAVAPRTLAWLRQRPTISTEALALLASLFFTLACNRELWHTLVADIDAHARLLVALFVFVTALQAFLLGLVLTRWTAKPLLSVLFVATAFAAHYIGSYKVYLDPDMIRNVLETDPREAGELIGPGLVPSLFGIAALPI